MVSLLSRKYGSFVSSLYFDTTVFRILDLRPKTTASYLTVLLFAVTLLSNCQTRRARKVNWGCVGGVSRVSNRNVTSLPE